MTAAIPGSKVVLKRGDGGAGAGVKASRTMGTSNSQLVIRWKTAGTEGNSKTAAIVVAGNNTLLSVVVTTSAVTINAATNSGGTATSTPNDIIAALYANATFVQYWEATSGSGTGTSAVVAAASASLSGGSAGGEVFTEIAEVKGVTGPSMSSGVVDVTSFSSPNNYREFMATLKDPGQLTFVINFNPSNATHNTLKDDFDDQLTHNYRLEFPDGVSFAIDTICTLPCILTGYEISAQLEAAVEANITLKITGEPIWA